MSKSMTNERLAELEEWAELGLLTRNNTRELVAEVRRQRNVIEKIQETYRVTKDLADHSALITDDAYAMVDRIGKALGIGADE